MEKRMHNGRFSVVVLVIGLAGFGCSHGGARSASFGEGRADGKVESAAEKAVEKTADDERWAPTIQKEMNAIFFRDKATDPGGLDAFSADRLQELEMGLMRSEHPAIKHYLGNREFFDRVEDPGGGFRVVANAKRLLAYRKTKAGRRKLFTMDAARVREMIANPCFSAIEDCGEYASDGEENTPLLDDWVRKYPEAEFRSERERVLRGYLAALDRYRKRIARRSQGKKSDGKEPDFLISTHVRGIQLLLRE